MSRIRRVLRLLLLGRRDGRRAALRARFGVFTWVDRKRDRAAEPPAPEPTTPKPVDAPAGTFVPVLAVAELQPGEITEVLVGDTAVAIGNVEGRFFAVDNTCPHAGGPLGDGTIDGCSVTCPYHGWAFDLESGACDVDESMSVKTYPVEVKGDRVWVDVT